MPGGLNNMLEPSLPALYTKIEDEHKLQNNYENGINELGMHNK
jgi:hypothetical protein